MSDVGSKQTGQGYYRLAPTIDQLAICAVANPGGRIGVPKEVRELARTRTEAAINRLAFWMQSEDPRASVAASNALLDRGYGKPVAPIEMDHHVNEFDGMTEEDLAEYIGQQMSKLGIN